MIAAWNALIIIVRSRGHVSALGIMVCLTVNYSDSDAFTVYYLALLFLNMINMTIWNYGAYKCMYICNASEVYLVDLMDYGNGRISPLFLIQIAPATSYMAC